MFTQNILLISIFILALHSFSMNELKTLQKNEEQCKLSFFIYSLVILFQHPVSDKLTIYYYFVLFTNNKNFRMPSHDRKSFDALQRCKAYSYFFSCLFFLSFYKKIPSYIVVLFLIIQFCFLVVLASIIDKLFIKFKKETYKTMLIFPFIMILFKKIFSYKKTIF